MCRKLKAAASDLYAALLERDVVVRRAIELQNLMEHCHYNSWSIDTCEASDMIVASLHTTYDKLESYAAYARSQGKTLCIISPYNNASRTEVCERIVANHPSTTVDNRAYLLVFNNHLPKQEFKL